LLYQHGFSDKKNYVYRGTEKKTLF
jgi:hypothetical protein